MTLTFANMAVGADNVEDHVRHLLRHLNDSAALRKNGLVGSLFGQERTRRRRNDREVVDRIREMVLTLGRRILEDPDLGARARRWYEIIVRCDIGGELHKLVADELAIGMRQFYRERRLAREYLARELQRELKHAATETTSVEADAFAIACGNVAALRNAGQTAIAASRAQTIFASADDPHRQILAASFAVELLADQNDHFQAQTVVDEARRILSQSELAEHRASYALRLDAAEARLLWDAGSLQRARAMDRTIAQNIDSSAGTSDHAFREFAIEALYRIAWRDLSVGEYGDAERTVATANNLVESLADPSAHVRAWSLISTGTLRNIRDGNDGAAALFSEALDVCQRNGLSEDAIHAIIALSVGQQLRGNLPAAVKTAASVIEHAEHMCAPVTFGLYCLRLAEAYASAHDAAQAAAFAQRASTSVRGVQLAQVIAHLIGADAYLSQGAFALALKSASVAESEAGRELNHRMQGSALRIIAEAFYGLGHASEAREYIASSIELLERAGHPFSLRRAYLCSAKISGKREHARYAEQIDRELRNSG